MFKSVKPNKVSEHIIEQVRRAILQGRLKPGDKLPCERELIEHFCVSKATLREALRSLEVLGFLEIRKGASGGPFVTEVDMQKASDCFTNFLHFRNLSLEDLSEVRLLLEPRIAEKAALSMSEEDLTRLGDMVREHEDLLKKKIVGVPRKNEIEFHRIIAGATGNPILIFILEFVENLLMNTKEILKPSHDFSKRVQVAHRRIHQAMLKRNGKKAREEMIKHIREVEKDLASLPRGQAALKQLRMRRNHGPLFSTMESQRR